MCYFAAIPAIIALAGTAVSTYASVSSAQSQKEVANANAQQIEYQRKDALVRGNIHASEIRDKARMIGGQQAAAFGAAGLDLNTGTPSDVLSETTTFGELDALKAINNAQREGNGLQSAAELELFRGRKAQTQGYMQAGSSLLSGATNLYSMANK